MSAKSPDIAMTLASLLTYSGALFIAAVIPGPGITAIVARALGAGFRETFFMGLGLVLGDTVYLTAVILGLAFVAQTFALAFTVIKIAGVIYLAWIAWKLWSSGLISADIAARKAAGPVSAFISGLLVTLGNPKTMLFYIALVPTLIDIGNIGVADYALLVFATFIVLLVVLVPYMALASRARSLLAQPHQLRILNRVAAFVLAGTAAFIATRAA